MSTTFGPPVPLDGPPPVPYPFGILSVSRELDTNERTAMGVTVVPYPPEVPYGFNPCDEGTFRDKEAGSVIDPKMFAGFTAYTPVTCSRRGVGVDSDFARRAEVVLRATDQHILERQLVAATVLALNPSVGGTGVDVLDNTGWEVSRALYALEDAIAATGRKGVIGMTPGAVAKLGFDHLRVVDGHLETANGTPVIAGQGFVDQVPTGQSAVSAQDQWAWAFGPVFHWRGEVYVPGDRGANLDRVQNVTTYRAERELLVGWDGILKAAVLVDGAV